MLFLTWRTLKRVEDISRDDRCRKWNTKVNILYKTCWIMHMAASTTKVFAEVELIAITVYCLLSTYDWRNQKILFYWSLTRGRQILQLYYHPRVRYVLPIYEKRGKHSEKANYNRPPLPSKFRLCEAQVCGLVICCSQKELFDQTSMSVSFFCWQFPKLRQKWYLYKGPMIYASLLPCLKYPEEKPFGT